MATNPMQRKARNSFLLGMLLMLVISGAIIALLCIQIKNYQDEKIAQQKSNVKVCVLKQNVKSGQVITSNMLEVKEVNRDMVPVDAIGSVSTISNYILEDKEGNTIITQYENNEPILYINLDNKDYEVQKDEETDNYYIERNGQKEFLELNSMPIVAKISLNANTVLTKEMIDKGNNITTDDIRKQEYNMIVLPSQIETGDYIDVRLSLPSGQDYIVISKKEVAIPEIAGVPSENTIWLNLSEEEILSMNCAIMDAYKISGSKLYITTYTEPGIQDAAIPTYPVNSETLELIRINPNILDKAKRELSNRYDANQRVNGLNSAINNNAQEADGNVKSGVEESITNSSETRKKYLDGLTTTN